MTDQQSPEADFVDADEIVEQINLDDELQLSEMETDDEEGEATDAESDVEDSVQTFLGHKGPVYSVDIHPVNETTIASGGGDDKGFIWQSDTGERLFELSGHSDSVTSVRFSTDGQYVATAGMDGKVKVWKVEDGSEVVVLEGPDGEIEWIDWHPKGNVLLAGASDSTMWMWSIPSGECMNVFAGHSATVTAGQFTPDGKKIVSASEDVSLIVWDPKIATPTSKISGDARYHSEGIICLAVHKTNPLVITGSTDRTARLVNLNSGAILGSFENHSESVETVGFCDILPLVATGSTDNKINIWDVTTMRLRQTCQHDDAVIKLQWHTDSPLFTSSSADRTVRQWDARTGKSERVWKGHRDSILGFAISRDGKTVVTAGDDNVCRIFKV
ncbi:8347_t:CDS:10 [Paraglomus brasilianum]|uniref:8347_t:CDS:1 n=1 Tax=Paraglomus brasilianum TaxID=144538 RepID=A0A9N8ZSZ6_9GLOM|nr:8347_t:CDS:10 [Paraglomus brasilianum]